MSAMNIGVMALGAYETNCYILSWPGQREGIVIDPGFAGERIIKYLEGLSLVPAYIIATHGHGDHIGAIARLKAAYPAAQVAIHPLDADQMADKKKNYSYMMGDPSAAAADRLLEEGDELVVGKLRLQVLHTPGHTAGGICLLGDGVVFAGDTLFNGSVGRTDLGGDFGQLEHSIRQKLYVLAPSTVVYPGHGPATTIGSERKANAFVRADSSTRDNIHG